MCPCVKNVDHVKKINRVHYITPTREEAAFLSMRKTVLSESFLFVESIGDYTLDHLKQFDSDESDLNEWMDTQGFLDISSRKCSQCDHCMRLERDGGFQTDQFCLRCSNSGCDERKSV